jgi:hypothetical protein
MPIDRGLAGVWPLPCPLGVSQGSGAPLLLAGRFKAKPGKKPSASPTRDAVNAEVGREVAYWRYTICERKKRAAEALGYKGLVQTR